MKTDFLLYIVAMAGVTYLVRMIPFVLVRGKIKCIYIQSFLYYVPYAVLGAMTFPYILYSTGNMLASLGGTVAAFVLALRGKSLIVVAASSAAIAYVVGLIATLFA